MQPSVPILRTSTDENLRETACHGNPAYPFRYYLEDVWEFDFHCIDWHWHEELECIYVAEGALTASVAGEDVYLPQGWGMFINSRAVHRFTAKAAVKMPNFLFLPTLLAAEETLVYRRYVRPVLAGAPLYVPLDPGSAWQAEVLHIMRAIFAMHAQGKPNELQVVRRLLEMWELLAASLRLRPVAAEAQRGGDQARLQVMLQYIRDHYAEPVTLRQVANAAFISRNSALEIFRKGIGQSPIAYMIRYRLQRAAQLLRTTEKAVSIIAYETGFSNPGYFCRKFKEAFGMSPNAYRKLRRVF